MILAAAIKYRIKKTDKEVVLCGCRHGDIFQQLEALGFNPRDEYEEIEQGFINHRGDFLNRWEAFCHAYQCGQLSSKIYHKKMDMYVGIKDAIHLPELISEDLW